MYRRIIFSVHFVISRKNHQFAEYANRIRNIGVIAHVDAGKTTTTERILYCSGKITRIGEVDRGNTVTDFLEVERNRGITVSSAFVTFNWKKHKFNLVDTPGHIDFTVEVEQSLNIVDSAVIILDATAGVEAQTITVWQQLSHKKLPSLVYINKMDRPDSNFKLCLESIKTKLNIQPLPVYVPSIGNSDKLMNGLVNVITMEKHIWTPNGYHNKKLLKTDDLYIEALNSRIECVEFLSNIDDKIADIVLQCNSFEAVQTNDIISAIKRVTLARKAVAVVCGSSFKNIGIETLLDSIIQYLPSPLENEELSLINNINNGNLIARCFKVIHSKQRGAITFFRIYNGKLNKGQKIYNISQNKTETIGRIMSVFGGDFEDIVCGEQYENFVAVTGIQNTICGDLICNNESAFENIKNKFKLSQDDDVIKKLVENNIHVADPVFFCTVEPAAQRYQSDLEKALCELYREDPSIRIQIDSNTNEIILAGMGELHLDIIKEKLYCNYGLKVYLGQIQVVYKEQIIDSAKESFTLENKIGSQEHRVFITLSLKKGSCKELLRLDSSKDSAQNINQITDKQISLIKSGIISALGNGPILSSQVINVHCVLHWFETKRSTPESFIVAAAAQCIYEILSKSGTQLLEPIMSLNIITDEKYLKNTLRDLVKRRGVILSVNNLILTREILCEVPLSELYGYAKFLRTVTSGSASLTMEFSKYRVMSTQEQLSVLKNRTK